MSDPTASLKPVYGQPELRPGWDDDGDPVNEHDCGWDLAYGCNLSFGHPDLGVEGGQLYICVAMAGQMTQRAVTGEQVAAFGLMLLGLAGKTVTECGMEYTNDHGKTVDVEPCDPRDWRDCYVSTDPGHHSRTVITLPDGTVLTSSWKTTKGCNVKD